MDVKFIPDAIVHVIFHILEGSRSDQKAMRVANVSSLGPACLMRCTCLLLVDTTKA